MDKTVFFILGPALVLAALGVAFLGLRSKDFPSKAQMAGVLGAFSALVVATAVFSVLNAQSEPLGAENKEAAKAAEEQGQQHGVQEADQPGNEGGASGGAAAPPAAPAAGTLKVTSPPDGALMFDPGTLEAKPGTVTIDYDNPSPVPHDIAIEGSDGQTLDETQPAANQTFTVSADLQPGEYVYYCTVPGHREAGMEGTLTVK
ncbi:MAG: cupredoxin domain-containing protein [Solirubrobacterales bacterium]